MIKEVTFEKTALLYSKHEGYDIVSLAQHGSTGEIGKPSVPRASFSVVIPPGARVKRVEVISSESEVLPGTYKIQPVQPPRPISLEEASVEYNGITYDIVISYPGKLAQSTYTGSRGDTRWPEFFYILFSTRLPRNASASIPGWSSRSRIKRAYTR